jgi:hypothetical protein
MRLVPTLALIGLVAGASSVARAAIAQQPPFPPEQLELSGTAVVSGRVTDEAGAPLAGVVVRTPPRDRFGERSTTTDVEGRYELRGLPPMSLRLAASLAGYAGLREGFEALRSVTLSAGEVRTVDLVLVRTGSIAGHVVGPGREPLAGAIVRVVPRRRRAATDRPSSPTASQVTNREGVFRLGGLPPGDYYLEVRPLRRGTPRPPTEADANLGFATVFYPGVPDPESARCVTVAPGTEATADTVVPLLPLRTIAGTVLGLDGRPTSRALVELRPRRTLEPDGIGTTRAVSPDPDGSFRLAGVADGPYLLVARETSSASAASQVRPPQRATGDVELDVRADLAHQDVRLTNGATARGRVVFASRPPANVASLQIYHRPKSMTRPVWAMPPVMLNADGTFEFKGLRGAVEFMVMYAPAAGPNSPAALAARSGSASGAGVESTDELVGPPYRRVAGVPIPIEWRVRALRVHGRDVTRTGVDLGQEGTTTEIVVEVSADMPLVTGIVRDDLGRPCAGATLVAIATDPAAADAAEGTLRPRGLSRQDGRYFMVGLPPGTWDLVALADVADPALIDDDEESLSRLRSRATRVTLRGSQTVTLDLAAVTREQPPGRPDPRSLSRQPRLAVRRVPPSPPSPLDP